MIFFNNSAIGTSIKYIRSVMKRNGIIFLAFTILATVFLGIGIDFHFLTQAPMSGDPAFYMWSMKWIPYALTHHLNPLVTNQIWGNISYNLTETAFVPALSLLLWPLTSISGVVFAYNVANILGLSLGAFGVYLLCLQFVDRRSSLVGGLVFFLSPYVWGQLAGHLNLSFVVAIPFIVLFYVLRVNGKISRWRFIWVSTLLLLLQFGVSIEIFATLIFIGFIALIFFFFTVMRIPARRSALIKTTLELGASILFMTLIALPYIVLFFKNMPAGTFNSATVYSSDIVNFLVPTITNLIFGNRSLPISSQFTGNGSEQGAYLGLFIIILMAGIFVHYVFYKKNNRSKMLVLLSLLIVTIIISLGPVLHFLQFQKSVGVLPWNLIEKLPLIKHALPVRFSLYTDIIIALLFAFWYYEAQGVIAKNVYVLLILLSLIPNPKAVYPPAISVPSFFKNGDYNSIIEKGETVLILPTSAQGGIAPYYQAMSNFRFKIAQEMAGPPPDQLKDNPITWLANAQITPEESLDYVLKTGITKIIVVGSASKEEDSLLTAMSSKLIKIVSNVKIYSIDINAIQQQIMKNLELPPDGINFKSNGNSDNFRLVGFSGLEPWGRWSDAKEATLEFTLPSVIPDKAKIQIVFNPLVTSNHSESYDFLLNGAEIGHITCTKNQTTTLDLEVGKYLQEDNKFQINIPNAATPKSLGLNDDTRLLGIGMISLKLISGTPTANLR